MYLKQLKLAGFKSFVDLTIVPFTSQLVAVVGPNGCGKSNIIDAIRWVMGESSLKNLRGDSIIDVIFNGSSHRKAVGQASAELLFDNSFGRLTGQYANYQEIALKRVVTRDGDSSYYLNNIRCRRRDIRDIFLGTGAGIGKYSIIGQGDISRLIEAKPEELRTYLEEAAGVSKYKERRRETMLRIEHTRENLARIADVREELAKQLQRLARQAQAAEHYKTLRAQERLCRIEIFALKWQALTTEQASKQHQIRQLAVGYEAHQAKATTAYQQACKFRARFYDDNELVQQTQTAFYQLGTEIARLEESIQQNRREKQQLLADQQHLHIDWQTITKQWQQDTESLQLSHEQIKIVQESGEQQRGQLAQKKQQLQLTLTEQRQCEEQFQQLQEQLNELERTYAIEQLRNQHLEQQQQQITTRLTVLQSEDNSIDLQVLQQQCEHAQHQSEQLCKEAEFAQQHEQHVANIEQNLHQQLINTEQELHQAQDLRHQLNVRHAALIAKQHTLTNRAAIPPQWQDKPRLLELLTVERRWQHACELVLGDALQTIMVESIETFWPELAGLVHKVLIALPQPLPRTKSTYPRLIDKMTGLIAEGITPALDKIYTADTLAEACARITQLSPDESIITPEGYWLGKTWIKTGVVNHRENVSLFQQQEELNTVAVALTAADQQLAQLTVQRNQCYAALKAQQQQLQQAQAKLGVARNVLQCHETDIEHKQYQLQQEQLRKQRITQEISDLTACLLELDAQRKACEQIMQTIQHNQQQQAGQYQRLVSEKHHWDEVLIQINQEVEARQAQVQQNELQGEREQLKSQQLQDNLVRAQERLTIIQERLEILTQRLIEIDSTAEQLQATLTAKLAQHHQTEHELAMQREQQNELTQQLEHLDAEVKAEEKEARLLQEKMQNEQMQEQALALKASAVAEALIDLDTDIETAITAVAAKVTPELRERDLHQIVDKIKHLGAINLAAIEEYEAESLRKQHLDEQYNDLIDALATLDTAIARMDKETQQRLQETFVAVSTAFQTIFPRLFGGGRAMLQLTCDNILEAGIMVMAQPPGKRNSTIHLLSGGEKAMTAVALIFAIFQLNPSPFCLLDEVDAPLDDVNIGRFCSLVKEMSQIVQFLFITHNKVTMELADHLIGVTMREPGVSRIVAVDVKQALSMSDTNSLN